MESPGDLDNCPLPLIPAHILIHQQRVKLQNPGHPTLDPNKSTTAGLHPSSLLVTSLYDPRRNGDPLQYSCLENPMDRGDWQAAVHGVARSRTRLSD